MKYYVDKFCVQQHSSSVDLWRLTSWR